ncbi:uncharacterized protein [Palaemon carinicauda]|uniref:uncharacterized protein n=1 Tax=Palaemon carinicauda TaxID=392227 RepID=UPI0035B69DBA
MFQGILFLAAIPAAFPSVIPQNSPCETITNELQQAFGPQDPHTVPRIPLFTYIRGDISYTFDFVDLLIKGFSNLECTSFHEFGKDQEATLNLKGHNLEFNTSHAELRINRPKHDPQAVTLITVFGSRMIINNLELRFTYDYYSLEPFNLCITRNSLQTTFHPSGISTDVAIRPNVTQELNDHPDAVVEAINLHLPRFAGDLTTILNGILCKPIPPTTAATPNPAPASTTQSRPYVRSPLRQFPILPNSGVTGTPVIGPSPEHQFPILPISGVTGTPVIGPYPQDQPPILPISGVTGTPVIGPSLEHQFPILLNSGVSGIPFPG